ncbi:MAG: acyltransferase [Clostridiales bacterium]|nr:acyltransferase [Clostridiales bacterium]
MILTALILIIYCVIALIGAKKNTIEEADCRFFSKDYTTVLKGLCCVIVVFVHVPDGFKNTVQDLIGSFAYICVTIFFMLSSYGLRYSFENKEGYSKTFFKNRVLVLLVPYIISCLLKVVCGFSPYSGGVRFVYVLLLFYIITFIAYNLPILKSGGGGTHMRMRSPLQFSGLSDGYRQQFGI